MIDYNLTTNAYINMINQKLDEYISFQNQNYDYVIEAMRYSLMNAGKRIRPILVLEFCRAFGGNTKNALPFACAVEMIHTYSLIHDDLPCMDDDDLRRGKPSCHKQFDEATALLAGDALLNKAFEVLSNLSIIECNPVIAMQGIRVLSNYSGVNGMIGGQAIDLAQDGKKIKADENVLNQMHKLKTSALIQASCELGAISAKAEEEDVKKAREFGLSLGLAFQIVDDILDVEGNEELLGKPIGSDAQKDKVTFVSLYGVEKAKEMASYYTQKALEIADTINSDYLKYMTQSLLNRKK